MTRYIALLLLLTSTSSFAATPFCVNDSRGELNLHFDALFDSAAQDPAISHEFAPSVLQGIFLRMKNLAHRDPIFAQKLKDTWCSAAQNTVLVKDVFLTEPERKSLHEDQEQVSMHIHVIASMANDEKQAEISIKSNQVMARDAQGTHLLNDSFELESFK